MHNISQGCTWLNWYIDNCFTFCFHLFQEGEEVDDEETPAHGHDDALSIRNALFIHHVHLHVRVISRELYHVVNCLTGTTNSPMASLQVTVIIRVWCCNVLVVLLIW